MPPSQLIHNQIPAASPPSPARCAIRQTYNPSMAVLYSEPPQGAPLPEPLPHKTWTREELALVESTGVLEGTHYELIEGELIDKTGKKFPHVRGTFAMAKLYARAGIPEYWVLDVDNRRLYLHRDPAAGLYQTLTEIDETGAVEPLAQPGHRIALTGLLPKT